VLAKLGIEVTCSDIFGAWGTQWLDELPLPQPYSWKVASLRQLTGWLTSEITVLEQVSADLLAGHDAYRAVQQLPGIGPVLGAVIVASLAGPVSSTVMSAQRVPGRSVHVTVSCGVRSSCRRLPSMAAAVSVATAWRRV
jgi:hypothetical protein